MELDGRPIQVETRKAIALLAYLACADRPVERERLADLLWPGSEQGRGVLRRTLAALSGAIGKEWLAADRQTIGLNWQQPGLEVDIARFRRNLEAAGALAPPDRLALWAETADLYRGRFLQGFTLADSPAYDYWQLWQAEQLASEVNRLYLQIVQSCQAQGAAQTAVNYARRWVALEPLHEPAQRQLIRSLAAAGERAAALQQYQDYLRLLNEEVGAVPQPETVALLNEIETAPLILTGSQSSPPLPQPLTPFVGRQEELTAVTTLLADPTNRLVVLHGPTGVGKSRLALEAVRQQVNQSSHLPLWAALSQPLTTEGLLSTLAALLSVEWDGRSTAAAQERLCRKLNERPLLLVLDGFTPFSGDGRLMGELMAGAPGLKLFVTIRERPMWPAALFYVLNGFDCLSAELISQSPLAQLFQQQARQGQSDYELANDDWPWLARLCQQVGGNPACIEQAATWLRLLPLPEIVRQIEQDPNFLTASEASRLSGKCH